MNRNEKCPSGMKPFNFEMNNAKLLGVMLLAKGCNLHPTLLFLHGFPGYEQNFDIAHMLRRNGYNVVIFHYRGAWGSKGVFSFNHVIEDTTHVYKLLKSPEIAVKYNIDTENVVLVGHSMGGFAALMAASMLPDVKKVISISGVNFGYMTKLLYENNGDDKIVEFLKSQTLDPLSGTDVYKLKNELIEINKKLKSEGIKKELLEKRKLIMEKLNILTKESGVVSKTLY